MLELWPVQPGVETQRHRVERIDLMGATMGFQRVYEARKEFAPEKLDLNTGILAADLRRMRSWRDTPDARFASLRPAIEAGYF